MRNFFSSSRHAAAAATLEKTLDYNDDGVPEVTEASECFEETPSSSSEFFVNESKSKSLASTRSAITAPPPREEDKPWWPHEPIYIQPTHGTLVKDGNIKIGVPFEFETPHFIGRALFRFRNLQTSNNIHLDKQYFEGRKRKSQCIIQGRFKKPTTCLNDIVSGSEFGKPLKVKPPRIVNYLLQRILKKSSNADIDLISDQPRVLVSLGASIQKLRVDDIGSEPEITNIDGMQEENSILFGGTNLSSNCRKQELSKLQDDIVLNTDLVYTFESYDDCMDYVTYEMDFRAFRYDMTQTLDGEPFQFMAKDATTGEYLWRFEIYNKRLLQQNEQQE